MTTRPIQPVPERGDDSPRHRRILARAINALRVALNRILDKIDVGGPGGTVNICDTLYVDCVDGRVLVGDAADPADSAPRLVVQQAGSGPIAIKIDNAAANTPSDGWQIRVGGDGRLYFNDTDVPNGAIDIDPSANARMLRLLVSETVLNDGGADRDFRVESDTKTHALFVQGSDGAIGINESSPAGFTIKDAVLIKGLTANAILDMVTNNGLQNWRLSVDQTTKDFNIRDTTAGKTVVVLAENSVANALVVNASEVAINDGGEDYDFRVESDTKPYALFLQGSDGFIGVNNSSPDAHYHQKGSGNEVLKVESTGGSATVKAKGPISGGLTLEDSNATSGSRIMQMLMTSDVWLVRRTNDAESAVNYTLFYYKASDDSLGIGHTSPTEALDVSGNIKASGTIEAAGGGKFLGSLSSDPGSPNDGEFWYNSTANKWRGRAGGATVDFH